MSLTGTMDLSTRNSPGLLCQLPSWFREQRICPQCGNTRFNPWVGKIPWSSACQLTPVFLSRDSHGQRSLAGYSPWGHKELDTIEQLAFFFNAGSLLFYFYVAVTGFLQMRLRGEGKHILPFPLWASHLCEWASFCPSVASPLPLKSFLFILVRLTKKNNVWFSTNPSTLCLEYKVIPLTVGIFYQGDVSYLKKQNCYAIL